MLTAFLSKNLSIGGRFGQIEIENENPKEVYESLIQVIREDAYQIGYDFLLCKTLTNHIELIHALQKAGFLLVDTLLDYVYSYAYKPMDTMPVSLENWGGLVREAKLDDLQALSVTPEEVVKLAQKQNTPSIAYTYNDPTIFG